MTGKLAAAILAATLAATIIGTGAVGAMAHEVTEGIRYGDSARNALDLYMPDKVENPPLVMFIHGGRWMRNDRTQVQLAALPADVELPPMLIMHGTQDVIVSPLQSRRLYGSLLARDPASDLTFIEVEGASHGGNLFQETVPLMVEFLSDCLR